MLHAFIASVFKPAQDGQAENKNGVVGWAVCLFREFEPGLELNGKGFVLETRASGRILGSDSKQGLNHGLRMASRIASTQTFDAGDGNMETMAVHLISEDGRHEHPFNAETSDPFNDYIELVDGAGPNAWTHGRCAADIAHAAAYQEARDGKGDIYGY